MKTSMVMTLIGRDRPGLVESVAAVVEDHGGNWEESRMVRLAGEFAGLVHLQVPRANAADLGDALRALQGVSVVVARAFEEEPPTVDTHLLELEVMGQDHRGIVHALAEALAAKGINIEEFESEVSSAPMTGQSLFKAEARLRAPKSVTLEELEADLEKLAADLMVDIRLEEP